MANVGHLPPLETFPPEIAIADISRDLHCVLRRLATSSCRGHVDESATLLSLLPHREHGTGSRHS